MTRVPFHLETLGGLRLLSADGRVVTAQRRRLALLALLAAAGDRGLTRDQLVGTLWPETADENARHALSQLLYGIRRSLSEDAISGVDLLRLDSPAVDSDVQQFERAIAAGAYPDAVAHYRGAFLNGFYLPDAPEFERRVEGERTRLATAYADAVERLMATASSAGETHAAAAWARTLAELDPLDARRASALMRALVAAGDSAGALAHARTYEALVRSELDASADPTVVALANEIRAAVQPVQAQPSPTSAAREVAADTPRAAPISPSTPASAHSIRRPVVIGMAIVAIALIAVVILRPALGGTSAASANERRTLVVLPMTNETGDSKLAYIATGIAEGVARRLEGVGGLGIRSGARAEWPSAVRADLPAIGRELGATTLLRTVLRVAGDSLAMDASIVDAATSSERTLTTVKFATNEIADAESRLAAEVVGALFREPLPRARTSTRTIDAESYRLTLEGLHQSNRSVLYNTRQAAIELFTRAVSIDPINATAWSGLASVWGSLAMTDDVPFDEGHDRASAAALRAIEIDSRQGMAWASLAIMRAMKERNVEAGRELLRKAELVEPSNPEIFTIKSRIFMSAHQWDEARDAARVARRLDPLTPGHLVREAAIELCADRAEVALRLFQSELAMDASNSIARFGVTRSLARLGRYDEAIASWRGTALTAKDSVLASALEGAKGREGYWRVRNGEGRKRLAALVRKGDVSPIRLAQARWGAGDADGGFRALEEAARTGTPFIYRLPCFIEADEFRDTPRFAAAVSRIGALKAR